MPIRCGPRAHAPAHIAVPHTASADVHIDAIVSFWFVVTRGEKRKENQYYPHPAKGFKKARRV